MAEFKHVSKKYGENAVLCDLSFVVEKDSPTVIMGESGCGKTTLLRIAAGLENADTGTFDTGGEKIAYMFQEPRLLPWKNAIDNILAVLPKGSEAVAQKYFTATGLDVETDGKKLPSELSGGMRQRVSFARFLAFAEVSGASILLLDEPFSALDDETAEKMASILSVAARGKTLLVVSHDEEDAKILGARIVKM